jgi:hypothetical protein
MNKINSALLEPEETQPAANQTQPASESEPDANAPEATVQGGPSGRLRRRTHLPHPGGFTCVSHPQGPRNRQTTNAEREGINL